MVWFGAFLQVLGGRQQVWQLLFSGEEVGPPSMFAVFLHKLKLLEIFLEWGGAW